MKAVVGQPVDHCALEAEPGNGAFQFVGRGARIGGRQGGEAAKAVGMALHRLVETVVDAARQRHSGRGVDPLEAGDRMRQHLEVDAGFVHLLEAQGAEIVEPLLDAARRTAGARPAGVPLYLGVLIMLFERNDVGFVHGHRFLPSVIAPRHSW